MNMQSRNLNFHVEAISPKKRRSAFSAKERKGGFFVLSFVFDAQRTARNAITLM